MKLEDEPFDEDDCKILTVWDRCGRCVGASVFQVHDQETARMRFVTVASDFRKRGIGKRMTKEFEAETLRRGFSRIYMHARVDALGFYEK